MGIDWEIKIARNYERSSFRMKVSQLLNVLNNERGDPGACDDDNNNSK